MSATLRHQVGKLLIAGVEGLELTATERAWLKLIRPSGVILFRRNIEEAGQTVQLLREAAEIIGAPGFRCIDLEGGPVDRFRDLLAPMPSPAAVFATAKLSLFKQHGRLIAQEARLLGFNTVFAPVLDLALPESSAVMRTRVVSAEPEKVIKYASAFLEGLSTEGILGCGKHFPGLGGGHLDSHQAMPVIQRNWETMWAEDIAPFRALAAKLPMIMVSHASYPKASRDRRPASVSAFWISDVLRNKIGYRGLVISDDMEMGGILTQRRMEEAAVEAVAAGTDLLEICKDPALVLRSYEALLSEAETSPSFRRRVEESSRRSAQFLQSGGPAKLPKTPLISTIERLRRKIASFGI
ncbi:MAG TPA: beta-N-acetylhexosaminidase [Pseudacidobacterium sp.]|nr:beta-N-acetylhexosaminidase [Pseudacidobacterium sp.]